MTQGERKIDKYHMIFWILKGYYHLDNIKSMNNYLPFCFSFNSFKFIVFFYFPNVINNIFSLWENFDCTEHWVYFSVIINIKNKILLNGLS